MIDAGLGPRNGELIVKEVRKLFGDASLLSEQRAYLSNLLNSGVSADQAK